MRTRWIAAAFVLCTLTGSAGSAQAPLPPAPVPIPMHPTLNVPADLRFRFVARQVQEALLMESCPPARAAYRRAVLLAEEIAAAGAFEAGLAGPARFHWDVARSDIARRQEAGELGCWEDSDPRFARSHVQMARDTIRLGLQELRRLSPTLPPLPDGAATPPANAAALRELARNLAQRVDPLCTGQRSDAFLAPARAELTALRQRLAGTPYALQLELGLADGLYGRGIPECISYPPVPQAVATRNALLETRRQIGLIEALVQR